MKKAGLFGALKTPLYQALSFRLPLVRSVTQSRPPPSSAYLLCFSGAPFAFLGALKAVIK